MKTNTHTHRWGAWALGAATLLAGGALAAACGGGTSTGYATAPSPTAASAPAPTTAPARPAADAGVKVGKTALGMVLTDARGFTLYTFSKDVPGSGKSAAEAQAAVWPPVSVETAPSNVAGAPGTWAVFTRADGKKQVTYNGSPLYTYAGDQAPGDTTGDKVGGVWFASMAAQPSASAPAAASMPTTQSAAAAAVAQPTMAPPAVEVPSPMPPTVAPEPTRVALVPSPTPAPHVSPSGGGYSYGY